MSKKLKSIRRRISAKRPGSGVFSVGTAGTPVSGGGGGGAEEDSTTATEGELEGRLNRSVGSGRSSQLDGGGMMMMLEMEENPHSVTTTRVVVESARGNPQGASDVARYDDGRRETIPASSGHEQLQQRLGRQKNQQYAGRVPGAIDTATTSSSSSNFPNYQQQATKPFQFISDDHFTRRVDSYDGQVITCSDSKLPTYEVGNYLGGGVAGVVYEGKRLRPVNEYPPVRVRGGEAFYPTFAEVRKMNDGGGNNGSMPPSSAPPVAMSMSSSSLSSIRRGVTADPNTEGGTGLFADVYRSVAPKNISRNGRRSPAHLAPVAISSPYQGQLNMGNVSPDDNGGCTSFLFGNCGCGDDGNVDDGQIAAVGSTSMPGADIGSDEAAAARQRYSAVDVAAIEVPEAFSSLEHGTPTNHVLVDDADAPNRSKREARALSRNAPQSSFVGALEPGRESSSILYEDNDLAMGMTPHLIEDMSETVAIKILNPVGFRLLDPEMLHKAVIVREGSLPSVEPDGSFRLKEEHVWWLVNPNSRNLRSLLRKNHIAHSLESSTNRGDDASEESVLKRQTSNFSHGLGGGIDRGSPERGLRLSLVATFVDPKTSSLRELPLPRCVEIWGHPPFGATDPEFEAMMEALLRLNAGQGSGIRRSRSSSRSRMDSRSPSSSGKDDQLAQKRGGSTVYCPALSAYIAVPAIPPKYLRWLKQRRLATKEVRNMMRIGRHRNVVHLYEVLELVQDSKSTMFLILELVRGGELFDLISSNSGSKRKGNVSGDELHEVTMRKFFSELASGINFIHQCGVAHRDLKPEVSVVSTLFC